MGQIPSLSSGASCVARHLSRSLFLLALGLSTAASATLIDRGNGLIYDTALNITWVQDADLCVTLNNCVNRNDTYVTGGMEWVDANTWAANLVYRGFSDWRLPYASVSAGTGPTTSVYVCTGAGGADEAACRDNEMDYMFIYNLGGTLGSDKTGNQTAVGGVTLANIQSSYYSGTLFDSFDAWDFFFVGFEYSQGIDYYNPLAAWAVRPGDVAAAVPEPASLLLFGVGALGLAWSRRRGTPIARIG